MHKAISQDEAMDNAIRFLTSTPENGGARKVMKARPRLHATKLDVKGVYAFNVEGGGFVVASGDSRTLPYWAMVTVEVSIGIICPKTCANG